MQVISSKDDKKYFEISMQNTNLHEISDSVID